MEFSRQEYWSRWPFPPARSNPCLLHLLRWQADSLPLYHNTNIKKLCCTSETNILCELYLNLKIFLTEKIYNARFLKCILKCIMYLWLQSGTKLWGESIWICLPTCKNSTPQEIIGYLWEWTELCCCNIPLNWVVYLVISCRRALFMMVFQIPRWTEQPLSQKLLSLCYREEKDFWRVRHKNALLQLGSATQ